MPTARNISKGVTTTDTTQKQTQKRHKTRHRIVPPPKITNNKQNQQTNKIVAKRINKHYRDKEATI